MVPKIEPYHQEMQALSEKLVEIKHKAMRHHLEQISERLPVDNEVHILESSSISHAYPQPG